MSPHHATDDQASDDAPALEEAPAPDGPSTSDEMVTLDGTATLDGTITLDGEPAEQSLRRDAAPSHDESEGGALLLELVEEAVAKRRAAAASAPAPEGVFVGVLDRLDEQGQPMVRHGDGVAAPALTTVTLDHSQVGQLVAIAYDKSPNPRPIVLGVIRNPDALLNARSQSAEAQQDGQRVELSADKEIVLRCGEASITLTRAGKILLKGKYVLSRSSGVNRIRGGSVQIN